MSEYKRVATSAEVWAVLRARHGDELRVYGSYSAPEGDANGDPELGIMQTEYAFEDGKWPIMGARTTWELTEKRGERRNEQTRYWLCYRTESQHEAET
jgi:hypothetical protein